MLRLRWSCRSNQLPAVFSSYVSLTIQICVRYLSMSQKRVLIYINIITHVQSYSTTWLSYCVCHCSYDKWLIMKMKGVQRVTWVSLNWGNIYYLLNGIHLPVSSAPVHYCPTFPARTDKTFSQSWLRGVGSVWGIPTWTASMDRLDEFYTGFKWWGDRWNMASLTLLGKISILPGGDVNWQIHNLLSFMLEFWYQSTVRNKCLRVKLLIR